jgi:predicted dehydrogenase
MTAAIMSAGLIAPTRAAQPTSAEDAHAIGVQAYLYLYPLVTMDLTRRQLTNVEHPQGIDTPMNSFANLPAFPSADMKVVVRPNFDTLYYQADFANGANLMTITGGHQIDALCYCLGEFRELAAFAVSQRDRIPVEETGELIAKTVPDQLVVNGIVGEGAVVSFQIRGGMNRGTAFLFEIHGEEGDIQLTATSRASMQRQELNVKGARGDAKELAELSIPEKYRWVPQGIAPDSRYNVAQLYARLAEGIRDGKPISPGFDAAVTRHRLLDAIVRASETGMKQVIESIQ